MREPEGDVLIFMTGQVSFFFFFFFCFSSPFWGVWAHFCDYCLWNISIYLNASSAMVLLIKKVTFYIG
jgi:hypothetical protein